MFRYKEINKTPKKPLQPVTTTVLDVNKDNTLLLSIFPQETWFRITGRLRNNEDKTNLSNSASFFRTLLSNHRVQFLFKNVLQVVAHKQLLGEFHCDLRDNIHRYDNRTEAISVILNSRLVCHAWNKAIEDLSSQMESEWTCGLGPKQNNAIHHLFRRSFEFSNLDKINSFLVQFGELTINPVFNRTVLITLTPHRIILHPENVYHRQISLILQKFGKHLLNCVFHEAFSLEENELAYLILINLLYHMPNLKHLEVINRTVNTSSPQTFPKPPKLEKLQSLTLYYIFTPVCNAIVRENSQISRLTAVHPPNNVVVFNLNYPFPFAYLEQLEISWWSWKAMRILARSKSAKWPLKKLKLHFCEHPNLDCEPVTWFELFDILAACFRETLEELEVVLPLIEGAAEIEQIQRDSSCYVLRLPKLRKLDLVVKNPANFGFLLGTAASLEHLRIEVRAFEYELLHFWKNRYRQNVQIWGLYDDVLTSNIWLNFPKLETVYIYVWNLGCQSYSRKDWIQLQRRASERKVSRTRTNLWKRRIATVLAFF